MSAAPHSTRTPAKAARYKLKVMCGRYTAPYRGEDIAREYQAELVGEPAPVSFNVAPTQATNVVLERIEDGQVVRQVRAVRWGLVPSWSKTGPKGVPLINARVETVLTKPSFRAAASRRRAIIVAGGYYEWQPDTTDAGKAYKQPYLMTRTEPLVIAALYELWSDPTKDKDAADRWLWSCTVITSQATDPAAAAIHDRTPVLLPADRIGAWLDPDITAQDEVHALLSHLPDTRLEARKVSTEVNNVRHDGPQLTEPEAGGHDIPLTLTYLAA